MNNLQILIADAYEAVRDSLATALHETMDIPFENIRFVSEQTQAPNAVKNENYNVLIMDYMGADNEPATIQANADIVRAVRCEDSGVKIIVMSGGTITNQSAIQTGADWFLKKPISSASDVKNALLSVTGADEAHFNAGVNAYVINQGM